MKVSVPIQKKVLLELFFMEKQQPMTGQTVVVPKEFQLEKLTDASSAKKKLMGCMQTKEENGNNIQFIDNSEVEFVPAEIVILKELFDAKKNWSVDDADGVTGLKEIFNPQPVEKKKLSRES